MKIKECVSHVKLLLQSGNEDKRGLQIIHNVQICKESLCKLGKKKNRMLPVHEHTSIHTQKCMYHNRRTCIDYSLSLSSHIFEVLGMFV